MTGRPSQIWGLEEQEETKHEMEHTKTISKPR